MICLSAVVLVLIGFLVGWVGGNERGFHRGFRAGIDRVNWWHAHRERERS